mmetsp:Transcript_62120/g.157964  ORF Transcript_62120/g.157964 Transcript_62120/m.157964 type:complete len:297 (-) Transcript_62120:103-993(-)
MRLGVATQVAPIGLHAHQRARVGHAWRLKLQGVVPPICRIIQHLAWLNRDLAAQGPSEVWELVVGLRFERVDVHIQQRCLRVGAQRPLLLPQQLGLPTRSGSTVLMEEHRGTLLTDEQELPLLSREKVVDGRFVGLAVGLPHARADPFVVVPEDVRQRLRDEIFLQPLPTPEPNAHLHVLRLLRLLEESRHCIFQLVQMRLAADIVHVGRVVVDPLERDCLLDVVEGPSHGLPPPANMIRQNIRMQSTSQSPVPLELSRGDPGDCQRELLRGRRPDALGPQQRQRHRKRQPRQNRQ